MKKKIEQSWIEKERAKGKHINNFLDRDDYNKTMQKLYDIVADGMYKYSGVKDKEEFHSQAIINRVQEVIIEGLEAWKKGDKWE